MISNTLPSRGQPKAMLIDLDDTIITDDAVSEETWQVVCRHFAPLVGVASAGTLYDAIKNVAQDYWGNPENHRKGRLNLEATRRELVRSALREIGLPNDTIADQIADTYSAKKEAAITPVPGAIEALQSLRTSGLRLALITNGGADLQRRKIVKFGLEAIFDFILIEGEFGAGKPHPSVYNTAMGRLNVTSLETWMVGDNLEHDIAGAQRLGIYSIWIDWRGLGLPLSSAVRPDRIVRNLTQLVDR